MRAAIVIALTLALAGCTTIAPQAETLPPAIRNLRAWTPAQAQALREEAWRRPSGDVVREAIIELEALQTAACHLHPRQTQCARICREGGAIRYGWCNHARH